VENLRKDIEKAAEILFVKYGIRSVSIDDICNELHISKKTFYTEYNQKEDLVSAVLRNINEYNQKEDDKDLTNSKYNMIDVTMRFKQPLQRERARRNEKFFRDLDKYYPEVHRKFFEERSSTFKLILVEHLKKGIEEGLFRKDINLDLFPIFAQRWFLTPLDFGHDKKVKYIDSIIELMMDGYMRMVCNKKGLEYYKKKYCSEK